MTTTSSIGTIGTVGRSVDIGEIKRQLVGLEGQVQQLLGLLQQTGLNPEEVKQLAGDRKLPIEVKTEAEKSTLISQRQRDERLWRLTANLRAKTPRGAKALLLKTRELFAGKDASYEDKRAWIREIDLLSTKGTLAARLFGKSAAPKNGHITDDQVAVRVAHFDLDGFIESVPATLEGRLGMTYDAYLNGKDIVVKP